MKNQSKKKKSDYKELVIMSHTIFPSSQITPVIPSTKTLSSGIIFLPSTTNLRRSPSLPVKLRKSVFDVKASFSPPIDGTDAAASNLERCFEAPAYSDSPSSSGLSYYSPPVMYAPVMKKELSSFGTVTLEKAKLDTSQKQTKSSPEVCFPFSVLFCCLWSPWLFAPTIFINYLSVIVVKCVFPIVLVG